VLVRLSAVFDLRTPAGEDPDYLSPDESLLDS
jgi:hypothetical protein